MRALGFPVRCLCVVLCVLAGCAGERAVAGQDSFAGEIAIGATLPLTGAFEHYGQSAHHGAITRVRMINEQGGINGKRLIVHWRDNKSDPEQAARDVEELARDYNVPAILGPLLSEAAMAAREAADRREVVVMSPMATTDVLVRGSKWMFRACYNNSTQSDALAAFQIKAWGAMRAVILHDPRYSFSRELERVFSARYRAQGGRVLGSLPLVDKDGKIDFDARVAELAKLEPDFIFAPLYAFEAIELIQALKRLDIPIRVCGPTSWDNEMIFDAAGRRLAGTSFASSIFERDYNYRPFRRFYAAMEEAGMETPDAQAASAYDAVTLLAEALKHGETADDVRRGLLTIKRFPLATGRLTIRPDSETEKSVIIRIVEIKHGRLTPEFADRYEP